MHHVWKIIDRAEKLVLYFGIRWQKFIFWWNWRRIQQVIPKFTDQASPHLLKRSFQPILYLIHRLSPPEMRDIWRNIMNHVLPVEKIRYIKKVLLLQELKKVNTNKQQKQLIRVHKCSLMYVFFISNVLLILCFNRKTSTQFKSGRPLKIKKKYLSKSIIAWQP